MQIIPVMDISNGLVVHAINGERQNYKSIKSQICSSALPSDVPVQKHQSLRFLISRLRLSPTSDQIASPAPPFSVRSMAVPPAHVNQMKHIRDGTIIAPSTM